ncbi:MAG TPA: BMP family ABC transporter substrate-binding protein [Erysipelotrichaceae bacterium]|nr:BMP family ABC transporter substrate-binding protein [Erysipelotrichaceae bacterium]
MKNKVLRIVALGGLLISATVSLIACGGGRAKGMKVGLICLHPANTSTYDKNFVDAFKASAKKLGFTAVIQEGVPEADECQSVAENLAETGCKIVFADSFGHEDYMIEAAKNYPNVQFCHATGVKAVATNLPNYHNAFASIYEGRYLAGVVAGMKIQAMGVTNHKIGYVAAHPYAEVISGYTSFYLGVKSIVSDVTMDVKYTDSWYDQEAEKAAANALIANNCVLISQHADSYGAPLACEEAGVPNVAYNGSTASVAPNTFLVSSRINWSPFYEFVVNAVLNEEEIPVDWCGGFAEGSVELSELGTSVAPGTQAKIDQVQAQLEASTLHVFDTSKFTINGQTPNEENMAPSKQWTFNYPDGTLFVDDGYYRESEHRSAPSFDVLIDGITDTGHINPNPQ